MGEIQLEKDFIIRFHARVSSGGRITIPETSRKYLRLNKGDFVKIRIKKVTFDEHKMEIKRLAEAIVYAKLASRGQITIPENVRESLMIKDGDIVEVDLLEYAYAEPRLIEG